MEVVLADTFGNDALGNPLRKFDVVWYGRRAGSSSFNRAVLLLGSSPSGVLTGATLEYRFQRFDPETDQAVRAWELVNTTVRIPDQVVKVHPDYYNDYVRELVARAKEQHGG